MILLIAQREEKRGPQARLEPSQVSWSQPQCRLKNRIRILTAFQQTTKCHQTPSSKISSPPLKRIFRKNS
ncbi:hypothetical protein PHJA_002995100 [Phtheirospermum japonicum]|uniref:Uncharacterized protein n=1 Tax=Phtheirospermum japonicum TaxID=374723 RepID=A0A830D0N1_9LAMI|nr:hypothetical protein PHJA_002482700 [Phtheirospermum japonicum]GFQ08511.1 hypothetical protein PHJA_002995100 [Phtheirospermum japonicum]